MHHQSGRGRGRFVRGLLSEAALLCRVTGVFDGGRLCAAILTHAEERRTAATLHVPAGNGTRRAVVCVARHRQLLAPLPAPSPPLRPRPVSCKDREPRPLARRGRPAVRISSRRYERSYEHSTHVGASAPLHTRLYFFRRMHLVHMKTVGQQRIGCD